MNTMADLRQEVAERLHNTLHGREIDTIEKGMPELEHMLGIVTLGAISTEKCESGTLLDSSNGFWQDYYKDVNTENAVREEVETAMQSLRDDGTLTVSMPYGDDAGIMYVEVDLIEDDHNQIITTCSQCGSKLAAEPSLDLAYGRYMLSFDLDCPSCEFDKTVAATLTYEP